MNKTKFRLACNVPHPTDGTSWHRALGPLAEMAADSRKLIVDSEMELELVLPRKTAEGWELTWDWVIGCDAMFMQRPCFPQHVQLAKLTKSLERPLWVEWDDDYTCIPVSNHHYKDFPDTQMHAECMGEIAVLADRITVATPEMGRRIAAMGTEFMNRRERKTGGTGGPSRPGQQENREAETEDLNSKIVVAPNACHNQFYDEPRRRVVMWRGTDTHDEDVCTVLKELGEVARLPQYSKWNFHFSGGVPWQVYQAIPRERMEETPFTGPAFFVPLLALMGGWVHIVPLKPNAFNRCKSNVAWIEATCAGSVVLAPRSEEWLRPGIVNYVSPSDFQEKLRQLMQEFPTGGNGENGEVMLHPNVELSREYIKQNLMLHDVNRLRWKILEEFAGREARAKDTKDQNDQRLLINHG